jgi:hypothetical protein
MLRLDPGEFVNATALREGNLALITQAAQELVQAVGNARASK